MTTVHFSLELEKPDESVHKWSIDLDSTDVSVQNLALAAADAVRSEAHAWLWQNQKGDLPATGAVLHAWICVNGKDVKAWVAKTSSDSVSAHKQINELRAALTTEASNWIRSEDGKTALEEHADGQP